MGLRCLITVFLWPPSSSIIRLWLPYSTKVLVKTNQTSPNSMGLRRLITEFLWPPSSSIIRLWLPHSTKVLGKTNQTSPNLMGLRRLITGSYGHLPAPSLDSGYHIAPKYSQDRSNEPKLDGVASFNYGVPMATFQLHHQTLVTI
ncbi:hypothetical protein EVAR_90048_1 [Eumeta japonica]|uniref:Uncharacterized protein n=1 Tax=Eumeta variegata TaxID=151549 RepID=A0A4C1WXG5_EUMVA|nr:hypothetical protein EVAR_90048_1 [Eumeta japonica]